MKDAKRGFTFYESFHTTKKRIRDKASRLAFLDAFSDYWFEGKEPDFSKLSEERADTLNGYWDLIKPVLDSQKRRKENSAKGGHAGEGVSRNEGNDHAKKSEIDGEEIKSKSKVNQNGVGGGVGVGVGVGVGGGVEDGNGGVA